MAITTLDPAQTQSTPEAFEAAHESRFFKPEFGRWFGQAGRLFQPGETPDIQVIRSRIDDLFATSWEFRGADFNEGINLRGENAAYFTKAIDLRDEYLPFHGVDPHDLSADVATKVVTDYAHYKYNLQMLLDFEGQTEDGKHAEQALPTGAFKVNGRTYFNAHIDDRDYFFIIREDSSWGQFTGQVVNRGATPGEWLDLGQDLLTLVKSGPTITDHDALELSNGHWIKSATIA